MIRNLLSLILSLLMVLPAGGAASSDPVVPEMSLYVINVRKADAMLLRSGETVYLIDTGTEDGWPALQKVLRDEGITRLTGVIITHTDKDHAGGIDCLVQSDIEIGEVYASAFYNKKDSKKKTKESKHPAVKALKDTGKEVVFLSGGDTLPLDGGTLEVLGPLEPNEEAENCNSLVLLATGGGGNMLLTGDMEFPEENSLLAAGVLSRVDVLKVANHGEGDATGQAFMDTVRPKVAVISTNSDDEPDTPSNRVLKLLARYSAAVYCTQDTENGVLVTLKNGEILIEMK